MLARPREGRRGRVVPPRFKTTQPQPSSPVLYTKGVASSSFHHQLTLVSERMEWNATSCIQLFVCGREGGREGALQRSHERAGLSHGIVSGFRIASPRSHATRSSRRRRRQTARSERETARMDGLAAAARLPCLSPTVRGVDFRINDLYLPLLSSTTRQRGRGRNRGGLLPQINYLIVAS